MKFSNEKLIEALHATGGCRADTARMLGVTRSAVTQRIQANPQLIETINDIEESRLDIAETALIEAIHKGKSWAIIFYLKCKGKARGYTFNHEPEPELPKFCVRVGN